MPAFSPGCPRAGSLAWKLLCFLSHACDCPCEEPGAWSGLVSMQGLECKYSLYRSRPGDGLDQVRVCSFAQTFVNDLLQGGLL